MVPRHPTLRGLLLACGACALLSGTPARAGEVTQDRLLHADQEQGNWIQHHRTYNAQRFSRCSTTTPR